MKDLKTLHINLIFFLNIKQVKLNLFSFIFMIKRFKFIIHLNLMQTANLNYSSNSFSQFLEPYKGEITLISYYSSSPNPKF